MILVTGIGPRRDGRIASQTDLAPALLSLIAIENPTLLLGQNLTNPDVLQPGRAMFQYDRDHACMRVTRWWWCNAANPPPVIAVNLTPPHDARADPARLESAGIRTGILAWLTPENARVAVTIVWREDGS
ncbi:MAG: hypothetical protein ACOH1P_12275 [Lysobacter sp.]